MRRSGETHVDGAEGLDEPAAQHALHLAVAQLGPHLQDVPLGAVLQQAAPQAPVQLRPRLGPGNLVLRMAEKKR